MNWMNWISEIAQVPGLLKEVYGDLAKPGVKQVGKSLGTIIGLGNTILWPVALTNEKARIALENNLEKYRKRLESTPIEDVTEVTPEIGVPIGEKITYVTNEELSDMYVELLAKASIKSSVSLAHPGFVNVINNLSPDEAILLKAIRNESAFPFIEVRVHEKGKTAWNTLNRAYSPLSNIPGITFPKQIDAYLSNFEGLGLVRMGSTMLADQSLYEQLEIESREQFKSLWEDPELKQAGMRISFNRGTITRTLFGSFFISACFSKQT